MLFLSAFGSICTFVMNEKYKIWSSFKNYLIIRNCKEYSNFYIDKQITVTKSG